MFLLRVRMLKIPEHWSTVIMMEEISPNLVHSLHQDNTTLAQMPSWLNQVYLTSRKFAFESNFAISLMANSLNSTFDCICIFINRSMIAYIMIEIRKSKFSNIYSVNLTNLSQVAKLNSLYIFIG